MTEPSRFTWTGAPSVGGYIGADFSADLRRQRERHDHMPKDPELLQAVRSRLQAATFARDILPDYASTGEILAMAEWLMGGEGEGFLDPADTAEGR